MKVHHSWTAVLILALAVGAAAQGTKNLGTVNGEGITEDQVNKTAADDLEALELRKLQNDAAYLRDKSAIMERALNFEIEDRLLTAEAAKRKVTKEQLIDEVEGKVTPPSQAEMQGFYEENKKRIPVSFEQASPQIREYMMDQQKVKVREDFFENLRKDYKVTSNLEPLRVEIATAGHPSVGPAAAPVTIIEFSDFQCPYCGTLYPVLKAVEAKYADTVRVVYRQFPLTQVHPFAQKAAEASLCALKQNHFWEYHDSLFSNQEKLDVDSLKSRAAELKLDTAAFNTCLDSGSQVDAIKKEMADGYKAGVTGTPGVFINGRPYQREISVAAFSRAIEDELERKKAGK